jgi:hypothetical protein
MLQTLAPGIHTVDAPQKMLGVELGTRMTVLQLQGGVLVYSPVAIDPQSIAHLGPLRWAVAPNTFHHLHVGPWLDAGAEGWAPPKLVAKRPDLSFAGELVPGVNPFGDEVEVVALQGIELTQEVVLHHRPSRTLIVTDLAFNYQADAPLLTKAFMVSACGYPGFSSTLVERLAMKRSIARPELEHLLSLDFDRVVLAHGHILPTGGKEALRKAFSWLVG